MLHGMIEDAVCPTLENVNPRDVLEFNSAADNSSCGLNSSLKRQNQPLPIP